MPQSAVHQQNSSQFPTITPRKVSSFLTKLKVTVPVELCPLIRYVGAFSNVSFHAVFTVWIDVEFVCQARVLVLFKVKSKPDLVFSCTGLK